ncbi:glycine--tRNA ligase subunit beta, partial [Klebsiella pneumoniae]|uniref:glycine--tRNA ligase subunit beta n=1 Tax=Klebsiella pneumoniae TaxID=573 RepID=UPI003A8B26EB
MAAGEYLLEVRSEEIPARMLEPGVRELSTRVFEELMSRGLGPREVETGYTPRRLVLVLAGLPEREPDRDEQVMGPPVRAAFGADGPAASGSVTYALGISAAGANSGLVDVATGQAIILVL